MLTDRASRARDWALFVLAALMPAVAIGVVGLRALRNEEAAIRREAALATEAAADRVSLTIERGLEVASSRLKRATPPTEQMREDTRRIAPPFAEGVVLGPELDVIAAAGPVQAPGSSGPSAADGPADGARCAELAQEMTQPTPGASVTDIRGAILSECKEARAVSGRWLWPIVALDPARPAPLPAVEVARWLDRHVARLTSAEREAVLADAVALGDAATKGLVAAIVRAPLSRGASIAALLRGDAPARALREGPGKGGDGLVSWRADASVGRFRALADGGWIGFVVDGASVGAWLDSSPPELSQDQVAVVVVRAGARNTFGASAPTVTRGALQEANGSVARERTVEGRAVDVPIAPGLSIRVSAANPESIARRAARSQLVLAGVAVVTGGVAIIVAAILFARMRAARRSSALRTDFVSAVSHELRTPIASVRMLAELLEERRVVEEEERHEIHVALAREARRLGDTVGRLLGFGRMEAGRYTVTPEVACVAEVVEASIAVFEERHPDLPRVERALDRDTFARIDVGEVRIAVDNLLANARKYAPNGAPYVVRVVARDTDVEIEVEDHGPGIARRDQARIFRPFERADDRLSRATEGAGIGLALVAHIARAHGGAVRVESGPGRGARFILRIPRCTP